MQLLHQFVYTFEKLSLKKVDEFILFGSTLNLNILIMFIIYLFMINHIVVKGWERGGSISENLDLLSIKTFK